MAFITLFDTYCTILKITKDHSYISILETLYIPDLRHGLKDCGMDKKKVEGGIRDDNATTNMNVHVRLFCA